MSNKTQTKIFEYAQIKINQMFMLLVSKMIIGHNMMICSNMNTIQD